MNKNECFTNMVRKNREEVTLYKPSNITVYDALLENNYLTQNKILLPYSGGLESNYCALSYFGDVEKVDVINFLDAKSFIGEGSTEVNVINWAAKHGYHTVYLGKEYSDGDDVDSELPFQFTYLHKLACEFNIHLVLPTVGIGKFDLFKSAITTEMEFNSCDETVDDTWCGKCFFCLQIALMYVSIGEKVPYATDFQSKDVRRWLSEIDEYINTGIDPVLGDCYSIVMAAKNRI